MKSSELFGCGVSEDPEDLQMQPAHDIVTGLSTLRHNETLSVEQRER